MAFSFLFRSSIKVGIVGGAVYTTIDQGIWGNSDQSRAAYKRMINVVPGAKESINKLKIKIPIDVYIQKPVPEHWNNGVIWAFSSLVLLPQTVTNYSKKAWNKSYETLVKQ